MNPSDEEPDDETEDEVEEVDRDEWLAQEVDASWTHLTTGDLSSGPTAGLCDVFVRREDDGSYSLRFFGEGLEPSDPPMELDPEGYATAEETVAALAERGFEIEVDDLPEGDGEQETEVDSG